MDSPSLGPLFDATFMPDLNNAIVRALERAYETACEHHVPERGGNEVTFGFTLYNYAVHELCGLAGVVDSVAVNSRHPVFRLRVGQYELACHRVGNSERDNIWSSFPNNDGAVSTMFEEQLWLPAVREHMHVEDARKLILAHLGNSEDGLRAVYLCVPGKTDSGRIIAWVAAHRVWRADEATAAVTPQRPLIREEVVPEPTVRRRTPAARAPEETIGEVEVPRKPPESGAAVGTDHDEER